MFNLGISTDGAAFQLGDPDDGPADELAHILRELADDLALRGIRRTGTVRDSNGNTVGSWSLS